MTARIPVPQFAATLALLALAAGLASCGKTEEDTSQAAPEGPTASAAPSSTTIVAAPSKAACNPNPSPAQGTKLYRWGDLTVMLPGDGQTLASGFSRDGVAFLDIALATALEEGVRLSADTGTVVADFTTTDETGAIEAVVATVSICPFDPTAAPWPYSGDAPKSPSETLGNLSYIRPEPGSGIQIGMAAAVCAEAYRCAPTLVVQSARSTIAIDSETGASNEGTANVHPLDKEAFARYLASVQVAPR